MLLLRRLPVVVPLLCLLLSAIPSAAATAAQPPPAVSVPAAGKDDAATALTAAVSMEDQRVEALRAQSEALRERARSLTEALNRYRSEASRQESVLALPDPDFPALSRSLRENEAARSVVSEHLEALGEERNAVSSLLQSTRKQLENAASQADGVAAGSMSDAEKHRLTSLLERLQRTVQEKRTLLLDLRQRYDALIERAQEMQERLVHNAESLDQRIQAQSRRLLFERTSAAGKILQGGRLVEELQQLGTRLRAIFKPEGWGGVADFFREESRFSIFVLGLLLLIAAAALLQTRRWVRALQRREVHRHFPWRMLVLRMLERSVLPGGIGLFLLLVDLLDLPHTRFFSLWLPARLLLLFTATRWVLDYLRYRIARVEEPRVRLLGNLLQLTRVIRWFGIGYLLVMAALGPEGILLFFARIIFELGLAVWCFRFWRTARRCGDASASVPAVTFRLGPALATASYAIAFIGIFMEAAGYGVLALYWYLSWTRTAVLWLWLGLVYMAIREWYHDYGEESDSAGAGPNPDDGLLRWLFIQLAGLAWVIAAVLGTCLAWDARGNVLEGFYSFIGKPVAIGKVQLSLLGFLYALLVLFVTYIVTRLGRYLLQEKVLAGRKLERGVKDSTTAISVYLLWGLGIVVALGVLGVNTTSLAVVFGALSIGIGFGLQNIFNNFISGIILLIERPIQVGDAVEVNGIWGEVRKINVRSTVVQTYDNASLIIPNSEFISNQVTNWSFKDQRIRRKVNVGVAYGSDIEKVRETMLEIAAEVPNVLRYPPPDVHFLEHGDSALIFMLRYWTHVDFFYSTSTDIRFAVDRLFRERGIEIAFPQRDIHIRSIVRRSAAKDDAED